MLGVFPEGAYEQGQTPLHTGDRLVLYTDGITEANDANGEEFGEERLIDLAISHRGCSAPAVQARLADAVAAHTTGRFQDDATLIVLAVD